MAVMDINPRIHTSFRRRRFASLAVPAAVLGYLIYIAFAFDLAGLASRARWDNGALMLQDFWSFKTHVTRQNGRGDGEVVTAIEGMRNGVYPAGEEPDWVVPAGDGNVTVELPRGNSVDIAADGAVTLNAHGQVFHITLTADGIATDITDPPDWINLSDKRVSAYLPAGSRLTVTRSKTEVFRRSIGWEMFFFDMASPFHGKSLPQLVGLAFSGDEIEPGRSNVGAMAHDVWTNSVWHHGDVAWAMFETLLMAFLGTFGAGLISLPLAFMAASNFAPSRIIRQAFRRVFDFFRGVDALIWTIVLSRAFGPGPLTGSLAILMTDTGSFGKLFSEALENVDEKPIQGLRSTGAGSLARIRWGVMPQIAPVILSQLLYYFESNTRSATIIGAITGGGIGLLLVQSIQTQKDWEHVTYYILLVVLLVMAMDWLSGKIRARLIRGAA